MEVVDAKQAFNAWNEKNYENFVSRFEDEQQSALKLLPLFLQTNNRLLPGYNGPDTPAGIYGYTPAVSVVREAKKFHEKFRFNQERPLKNTIIESVFLQHDLLSDQIFLWVVHIEKLKSDQFDELENKILRIQTWLKSRDLNISTKLLTAKRLSKKSKPASIFLDTFYHSAILLAGKYPVWWLVPPEKEENYTEFVEHIKTARFVNSGEFIDLGGIVALSADDSLKLAIKHAQNIYKTPEISFLELLLLKQKQDGWPDIGGLAYNLKTKIFSNNKNYQEYYSNRIMLEELQDALDKYSKIKDLAGNNPVSYKKLFGLLSQYAHAASKSFLKEISDNYDVSPRGVGVVEYLDFNKILFSEIQTVYLSLLDQYDGQTSSGSKNEKLMILSQNILSFLSQRSDRIPVYVTQDKAEFVLGRMLLRHNIESAKSDSWSLIMELDEGEEKIISVFDNIITLIIWAWLNRVVDRSTQVSIQCPQLLVKQTEARNVLETLIQNINPDVIANIPSKVFERPNRPVRSLLFFNLVVEDFQRRQIASITRDDDPLNFGDESENLFTSCEQLVINSWGDVYTKIYTGTDGVLQCLCDWTHHAALSGGKAPQELKCFGYGSGESTYMAQRIDQVYEELIQFFYYQKKIEGCLVVRMGDEYYAVTAEQGQLHQHRIGRQSAFYPYLERPNVKFKHYMLERLALPDMPLREIFQRNKKELIQIFFKSTGQSCETWVLDEKGSLCHIQQELFNRPSYIAHWLYVMRNIRARLKKINYQDRELPSLEIFEVVSNRLGGIEFFPVGSEDINTKWGFIDIQVVVTGNESNEKISLICEGKNFDFDTYEDNVVTETIKYISENLIVDGAMPIYVTDVDAPLRLYGVEDRDNIQIAHFLKYMRNIENTLNKLLYS
jgi:adenylate cyclase, class 1